MCATTYAWTIVDLPWEHPWSLPPICPDTSEFERSRLNGRTLPESYEHRHSLHVAEARRRGLDWDGLEEALGDDEASIVRDEIAATTQDLKNLHKAVCAEMEELGPVKAWRAKLELRDLAFKKGSFRYATKPGMIFELSTGERYLVGHGATEWPFRDNAIVHRYTMLPDVDYFLATGSHTS